MINITVLSIFEHTREIGMPRTIGIGHDDRALAAGRGQEDAHEVNRRSRPPAGTTGVGVERGAAVEPVDTTSSSRLPPSARMT